MTLDTVSSYRPAYGSADTLATADQNARSGSKAQAHATHDTLTSAHDATYRPIHKPQPLELDGLQSSWGHIWKGTKIISISLGGAAIAYTIGAFISGLGGAVAGVAGSYQAGLLGRLLSASSAIFSAGGSLVIRTGKAIYLAVTVPFYMVCYQYPKWLLFDRLPLMLPPLKAALVSLGAVTLRIARNIGSTLGSAAEMTYRVVGRLLAPVKELVVRVGSVFGAQVALAASWVARQAVAVTQVLGSGIGGIGRWMGAHGMRGGQAIAEGILWTGRKIGAAAQAAINAVRWVASQGANGGKAVADVAVDGLRRGWAQMVRSAVAIASTIASGARWTWTQGINGAHAAMTRAVAAVRWGVTHSAELGRNIIAAAKAAARVTWTYSSNAGRIVGERLISVVRWTSAHGANIAKAIAAQVTKVAQIAWTATTTVARWTGAKVAAVAVKVGAAMKVVGTYVAFTARVVGSVFAHGAKYIGNQISTVGKLVYTSAHKVATVVAAGAAAVYAKLATVFKPIVAGLAGVVGSAFNKGYLLAQRAWNPMAAFSREAWKGLSSSTTETAAIIWKFLKQGAVLVGGKIALAASKSYAAASAALTRGANAVWNGIQSALQSRSIKPILTALTKGVSTVGGWLAIAGTKVADRFQALSNLAKPGVARIANSLRSLTGLFGSAGSKVGALFTNAASKVVNTMTNVGRWMLNHTAPITNVLKGVVGSLSKGVTAVTSVFAKAGTWIASNMGNTSAFLRSGVAKISSAAATGLQYASKLVGSALSAVSRVLGSLFRFVRLAR